MIPVPFNPRPGRATFCLNMIVRDEAHVIERCLESVRPMLDYVRIIDTGSTDDTVHLIRSWCFERGINCIVGKSAWVDFATNRNEALTMASVCEATHLILIDADEIMHISERDVALLRPKLAASTECLFSIPMLYGNNVCTRTNLVRNLPDGRLRYQFPIHEELVMDGDPTKSLTMIGNPRNYALGPHVTTPQDGARSKTTGGIERDLFTLAKAYQEDKNPRHIFYMGQLTRIGAHSNGSPEAWAMVREIYTAYLRAMAGNYQPHCYVAALWVARVMEMEGRDPEAVLDSYMRVHDFDPGRPEAMGNAADFCLAQGNAGLAHELALKVADCRGSNNYAFLETKWYARAEEIIEQTKEVKSC